MSKHTTIAPQEAADRLAIRELVEAYAHCVVDFLDGECHARSLQKRRTSANVPKRHFHLSYCFY